MAFNNMEDKWHRVFCHLDKRKDGYFNIEEINDKGRKYRDIYTIESSEKAERLLQAAVVIENAIVRRFGKEKICVTCDEFVEAMAYYSLMEPKAFREHFHTYFSAVFDVIDENGDGYTTWEGFRNYYVRFSDKSEELERARMAFEALNDKGDGKISRDMYVNAYLKYFVDPETTADKYPLY